MTDDDKEAFRRAMSGARPLDVEERVLPSKPKPKPRAKFARADEEAVLHESLEDDIDDIEHGYSCAFIVNMLDGVL